MKNEKFERLLSEIRNERVDDKVVAQAGERVYKSIGVPAPPWTLARTRCAAVRIFRR